MGTDSQSRRIRRVGTLLLTTYEIFLERLRGTVSRQHLVFLDSWESRQFSCGGLLRVFHSPRPTPCGCRLRMVPGQPSPQTASTRVSLMTFRTLLNKLKEKT